MSRSIDERVVSMEFDNSNFEKNVKTSLSTLDRLKEALHLSGASKGLEDFGNSIEQTGHKFSALEVIATGALLKIGSQAVSAGERLLKSISVDQVAAGWQKFADKTTSVSTLVAQGNAIEDVNTELNKLNWFTDETSYNFTEMVANIAKFTATGKGLTESVTAMEGIATWAALSGQNAQTASRAMYQLSQAMGSGYMRLEDYKSIQNASMDTDEFRQKTIEAAIELGTLKQVGADTYQSLVANADAFTKSQFAKSLTEGEWFTSDVMMKVFTEYSSAVQKIYEVTEETEQLASQVIDNIHEKAKEFTAQGLIEEEAIDKAIIALGYVDEAGNALFDHFGLKAFEAAQKARTFRDAIDSVKDAVSTGWMNTFELIFGNAEEATEIWTRLANSMYDVFAEGGNRRNEWLQGAFTSSWSSLTEQIQDCGIEVDTFEKTVSEAAKNSGIDIDSLVKKYGSLEKAFQSGDISADNASSIMKKAFASLTGEIDNSTKSLEDYQKLVDEIWNGDWGNLDERFKALNEAGYDHVKIQELVNKCQDGYRLTLEDLNEVQLKSIGLTDDQVEKLNELKKQAEETGTPLEELINNITRPSGRTLLIETFANVLGSIGKIMISVREAFQNVFLNSDGLYNTIAWWNELTGKVAEFINLLTEADEETGLSKLTRSFQGLFAAIDIVLITIKDVAKGVVSFVESVLSAFGFKDLSLSLIDFTANLGDSIVAFRDQVREVGLLKAAFGDFADYLSTIASGIKKAFLELIGKFKALDSFSFSNILTILTEFKDKVKEVFSTNSENTYAKKITTICTKISNALKKVWSWIKNIAAQIYAIPIVNQYLSGIVTWIQNIYNSAMTYFEPVVNAVQEMIEEFKNLDEINLDNIFGVFNNFKEKIKNIFGIGKETKEIGDNVALGLVSGLRNGIKTVIKAATDFVKAIIDTVTTLLGINSPSTVFIAIGGFIIAGLIVGLTQGFGPLQGKLGEIVDTIVNIFSKVDWNKVFVIGTILIFIDAITKVTKSLTGLTNALTGAVHPISEIVKSITGFVNGMKTAISNKINAQALQSMVISILMLAGAVIVLSFIPWDQAVRGFVYLAGIVGMMAAIIGLFKWLNKSSVVLEKTQKTSIDFMKIALLIASIGTALLMLAYVVKIVGAMDGNTLLKGLGFITGVIVLFGGFISVFSLLDKCNADMSKAGTMLLKMSVAMILLAYVIKIIGSMDDRALINGFAFIAGITILFGGFMAVFALLEKCNTDMKKVGTMLLKMAAAMVLLTLVVKIIGSMDDNTLINGFAFIAGIMILFGSFVAVFSLLNESKNDISKAGSMALKLSAAMAIMVLVVKMIATTSGADIFKAYAFIIGVGIIFGAMLFIFTKISDKQADMSKAGSMMLKMAAAIGILALVVKILGSCTNQELGKALTFVTIVSIIFAGLLLVFRWISKDTADMNNAGNMLMKMSVPLLALVACVALLSFLKPEDILKGTLCMTFLMGMFAVIIKAASKFGEKNNVASALLAMAGSIAVLVGCVWLLTTLDTKQALIAIGEIVVLIVVLIGAMYVMSKLDFDKGKLTKSLIALGSMVIVVGLLSAILWALDTLDVQTSISNVVALCSLLLVMSAACYILSKAKFDLKELGKASLAMVALTGILAFLGLVLWEIQALNIEASINNVLALSILLGVMAGITILLSKFGKGSLGPAIEGAISMAAVIAILGVVIEGLVLLAAWGLPYIGEQLSAFMENASGFFEGIKNIDEAGINGALGVAKILSTLAGAEIATAFANLFSWFSGSSMADLGDKLCEFGKAVVAFSEVISGKVDTVAISGAVAAASIITTLYDKLPKDGGWAQKIFGKSMSLTEFATQMSDFADAIVSFSSKVSAEGAVNQGAVQAAIAAGEIVATLYDKLPKEGGLSEVIFGGTMSLTTFANQMGEFATGIVNFSSKVGAEGAIDQGAVQSAISAGEIVATLYDKLPKDTGGLSRLLFGGTMSLTTFATQMQDFATGITSFSSTISDGTVSEETVQTAINAGKLIAGLYEALPQEEGVIEKIANFFSGGGKMSMSDFGSILAGYGSAVSSFYESLSGITPEALTSAVDNTRSLTFAITHMKDMDVSGVDKFTEAIGKLADSSVSGFVENFSGLNEAAINAINILIDTLSNSIMSGKDRVVNAFTVLISSTISSITANSASFLMAGTLLMINLISGIQNGATNIGPMFTSIMASSIMTIIGYQETFMNAGMGLIKNFKDGITFRASEVTTAISTMMTNCETAVTGVSLYNAGVALVDGFASGITAETFAAEAAAKAMAEAAEAAAKKALDINSPSKVFRNMAYSVPEGFAQGIDKMQGLVENSSVRMAQSAIDSAKSAISRLSRVVNSDIDSKPTIRPVVDLDAFDTRTIQLGANIDASIGGPIHSLSNIIADYQDGIATSNNEVINAVNGLRSDLNAMYNSDDQEVALYVDSKKLASTLAKPMNRQLNILSKRGAY